MLQPILTVGRILLVAVVLLSTGLCVMTLIAFQVGVVSAIFVTPDSPWLFDHLFLSDDYVDRIFQITGIVLAYEFYVLVMVVLFPFLFVSGDFQWW